MLALVLSVAACGGGDDSDRAPTSSTAPTTTAPAPDETLDALSLTTEPVATVDTPTAMATPSGTDDLYVAEQAGIVRRIAVTVDDRGRRSERLDPTPVLDLTDRVRSGGEQGLLGLAFSSDGRRLYVAATLQPDGRSWVGAFDMAADGRRTVGTGRDLLTVPRKFANHNGGQLAVGPDGFLYIGLGDGGSGGDPDGNGQNTGTLLGSILRIDPDGATARTAYGIPPGNPFDGDRGRPEIWLYGVRNPWRFSFDRATGDLWIADVGQGEWEEIDFLPAAGGVGAGAGANLGWDRMEGTHPFEGTNPPDGVLPVFEYSHDDGACAVVGGYVYRGRAIPALDGVYLYTDYCRPGLRALRMDGTRVAASATFDLPVVQVQSFGEDNDGEVYLLLTSGAVLRLAGDEP